MKKKSGRLITFEGGEGAGKTTQVALLKGYLEERGLAVTVAREPGGTAIGEQIRGVLLNVENTAMAEMTEILLYQAARAQVYCEVVCPALARGEIVLMDRSAESSVVYQGMVRGLGVALIERLNRVAMGKVKPEITFLLDVPVVTGFRRKENEKLDRLEQESRKFHEAVRQGYLRLAKRRGYKRIKIIDGVASERRVHAKIVKILGY
jgi:dTMP kinase